MAPVSLILVTWNGLAHTRACLESLGAAGFPPSSTIVVDNGSSDGTPDFLRASGVRLIENGANLGFARAVNRGITAAPADHDVVLLNNDVRVTQQDWLERLLDCAREHPRAGAIATRLVYPDGRLQDAGLRLAWSPLCIRHYGVGETDVGQFPGTRTVTAVSFTCVWLRREALRRTGPLDEDYFCYFEDVDLCLRLGVAGYEVLVCGDVTLAHEEHASSRENRSDHGRVFREAQAVFERKWPAPPSPPRGDLLALLWPDADAGSAAAIARVLYGLEDFGWRVSQRPRLGWGSPLDRIEGGDEWDAFLRAQLFRLPVTAPRVFLPGSALGASIEGSGGACILTPGPPRGPIHAAWVGTPWFPADSPPGAAVPGAEAIGSPVDPDYFFPRPLPEDPLTVAAIVTAEGAARLLRAFSERTSRAVRLVCLVSGPEDRTFPASDGIEIRRVEWPGAAERARLYARAHAFLDLDGADAWGLFAAEAARSGRAVLSSRAASQAPLLDADDHLPLTDPDALRETLESLEPSLASRIERQRARLVGLPGFDEGLTLLSERLLERGRPEPERFPAGVEPEHAPLQAASVPGVGITLAEAAAARAARLAISTLHLRAGLEGLAARADEATRQLAAVKKASASGQNAFTAIVRRLASRLR